MTEVEIVERLNSIGALSAHQLLGVSFAVAVEEMEDEDEGKRYRWLQWELSFKQRSGDYVRLETARERACQALDGVPELGWDGEEYGQFEVALLGSVNRAER